MNIIGKLLKRASLNNINIFEIEQKIKLGGPLLLDQGRSKRRFCV